VEVDDAALPATPEDSAALAISVTQANEAPTASDAAFSVAENSATGTVIGSAMASDPDAGDTLTYAITGGDPSGASAIDAATGEITVGDASRLDFETTPVFNLTVSVTDSGGLTDTAAVTVNVKDVNEAPTAGSASFSVAEDSANGTVVGGVSAGDPDAGDTLSYAITGGDPGGLFAIDATTGEITVADRSQLDFDTTPVFNLTVTVTDAGGLTDTMLVPIEVQPVDEPPVVDTSEIPPVDEAVDEEEDDDATEDSNDTGTDTTQEEGDAEEESEEQTTTATSAPAEQDEPRLRVPAQVMWNPVSFSSPGVELPTSQENETSQGEELLQARRDSYHHAEPATDDDGRFAIVRNQQMLQALDQIRQEMADHAELVEGESDLIVSAAEEVALAFSAGLLGILLRGSSLAAVALSALPVWRRVDPLAILALSDEERRKREEELRAARDTEDLSEEAVGRLLD
jgi:hypothetical protein